MPALILDKVFQHYSLANAIRRLYKCETAYLKTVFIDERFEGQIMWQGDVHVFEIQGIPRVSQCYALEVENEDGSLSPVFLLNQWPVTSPQTAVQAMISLDALKPHYHGTVHGIDRERSTTI